MRVRRALALIVVAALAAACTSGGQSTRSTTSTSRSTSTTQQANLGRLVADVTPPGWAPVDDSGLQVSVPGDWVIEPRGGHVCGEFTGEVFVGEPARKLPASGGCRPVPDVVALAPIADVPRRYANEHPLLVNGVPVLVGPNSPSSTTYYVPSLNDEVTASGPLARRVLATVTHSPWSVVLAKGPSPTVPPSWKRVAFGGISFAVPTRWPVERSGWPWCASGVVSETVVAGTFNTRSSVIAPPCPGPPTSATSEAGHEGVLVAVGPYAPLAELAFRVPAEPCFHLRGLTPCAAAWTGTTIDLRVSPPNGQAWLEIGLAGNGMVARTIIYSIRSD